MNPVTIPARHRPVRLAAAPNRMRRFGCNRPAREAFDTQMYRPTLKPRDRLASLALVGALHFGLILALLNLSGAIDIVSRDDLTQLIDLADPPVPPPAEEVPVELEAAPEEEGEASPPNI